MDEYGDDDATVLFSTELLLDRRVREGLDLPAGDLFGDGAAVEYSCEPKLDGLAVSLLALMPQAAQAQTVEQLQSQIDELKAQVQALTAALSARQPAPAAAELDMVATELDMAAA